MSLPENKTVGDVGHTTDHNAIAVEVNGHESRIAAIEATVVAGGGPVETVTHASSTYLAVIRPEKYGAVGDGIADDTVAINSAIAAANAVRGTVALTRNATYKVTAVLTALAAGVTVDGYGATITVPTASEVGVLTFAAVDGVTIRRLTINGNRTGKTTDAFAIYGSTGSTRALIEDVIVTSWHGTAIRVRSSDRVVLRGVYVTDVRSTSLNNGHGIQLTYDGTSLSTTNALVSGCHTRDTARSGIVADGDWNHADWRTGSYAKFADASVIGCTAHTSGQSSAGAGIFINSGLRVVVSDCHANDSASDYGIGLEYCLASTIANSTADSNAGNGFSLYASDETCQILGCQARDNAVDGIAVQAVVGNVPGDTATDLAVLADNIVSGSGRYGLSVLSSVRIAVNGGTITGGVSGVYGSGCTDLSVRDVQVYSTSDDSIRILTSAGTQIVGCKVKSSAEAAVSLEGTVGTNTTDTIVSGCQFDSCAYGVRLPDIYARETLVSGCHFVSCGYGVTGNAGSRVITISGCHFKNSTTRSILCTNAQDWRVIGNTFQETVTAIEFTAAAGVSSTRITVKGNFITASTGIRASAGLGGSIAASDWWVIEENFINAGTHFVWSDMGTVMGVTFAGRGSGTPEGSVYANPGSRYYRTDGGYGTTLYVKESGVGNTGWVPITAPATIIPAGGASFIGATAWPAANRAIFSRFTVTATGIYRYANLRVDTQSGNIQVGIVQLDASNPLNFTRVAHTGVIACPAAGNYRADLGATVLTPGDYALFVWADNTSFQTRYGGNTGLTACRQFASLSSLASGVQGSGTAVWDSNLVAALALEANNT